MFRKIIDILEMIKFSHTLFALPFAVIGACYAAGGLPAGEKILWILVAMVAARSAAMGFNRIADADVDARNPRTKDRAIPRGRIGRGAAALFTAIMGGCFVVSARMLNETCFLLSPVALLVILGYSYTKRFTFLSHFVLGLGLAIAPAGAWIAVRETLDLFPLILSGGVLLWVSGFDLIYACADIECDRREGLHSIPARIGLSATLRLSAVLHLLAIGMFGFLIWRCDLGIFAILGLLFALVLLVYEHAIVKPGDLRRLNEAFFLVNVVVGLLLMCSWLLDLFLKSV